ncbi:hypothetical protein IQ06DRAFT_91815 [Phaeosphaeriaceae sp. SRC1lsM3a]|nr:hypothetical protein IQ06DRAFT_91815 [Stagonospora sp. SRC1lsM3a]
MASISDAHETVEIPIIAAALQRLVLPRQSQIWAVLNPGAGEREHAYRLASTFLGRMCLSGDVGGLNPMELEIIKRATAMYRRCVPVIRGGKSKVTDKRVGESWRHPQGWQSVLRYMPEQAVVVVHGFEKSQGWWRVDLPAGEWRVLETLTGMKADVRGGGLEGLFEGEWEAQVVLCGSAGSVL